MPWWMGGGRPPRRWSLRRGRLHVVSALVAAGLAITLAVVSNDATWIRVGWVVFAALWLWEAVRTGRMLRRRSG
jgi:hypothetical protein